MGIKDLLKFMKPYVEPIHINKYAGKRVGIDAYSWLHKGAYSCSMELCLNTEGDKKLQFLNYCMHRINLLRHYKITPVVVFDGGSLPCKAATEEDRHSKRKSNRELAMAKLKEGNVNAASELFQRAVSITPSMAHQLIQILRSENIEFVVAPYEADAQLAYLSNLEGEKGGIEVVISEDSDLLAYGCPCVVFKMDRYGNGEEIVLEKVFDSVSVLPSFRNFDKKLFAGMCVLAGCDFLPSVPGIGIGKAHSFVSKYRNLDRVLSVLKFEKGKQMPEDYLKSFKEALAVFQHAQIYDANSKRLKHLKPLPQSLLESLDEELDSLGPDIPPSIAIAIAEGKLDPCTMEAFNCSSSPNIHLKIPTSSQTPFQISRPDPPSVSPRSSCFSVVSSHKTRTKRITAIEKGSNASEESKQTLAFDEKYMSEAIALEKLAVPFKNKDSDEIKIVFDKSLLTVPNNNPFKRKVEEIMVDQLDSCTEEVSVVNDVESLEIICVTPQSQASVDSKSFKTFEAKKRVKSEKKLKRSNCQSSENKSSSILNFFSRVWL